MDGGTAPAQVVIVHAWQVVVDQRIGVDAFHRDGGAQQRIFVGIEKAAHFQHEERPHALAAGERGVAHRLEQALLGALHRRQQGVDGGRRALGGVLQAGVKHLHRPALAERGARASTLDGAGPRGA